MPSATFTVLSSCSIPRSANRFSTCSNIDSSFVYEGIFFSKAWDMNMSSCSNGFNFCELHLFLQRMVFLIIWLLSVLYDNYQPFCYRNGYLTTQNLKLQFDTICRTVAHSYGYGRLVKQKWITRLLLTRSHVLALGNYNLCNRVTKWLREKKRENSDRILLSRESMCFTLSWHCAGVCFSRASPGQRKPNPM